MGKRLSHVTTRAAQPARDVNRAERVQAAIAMRKAGHEWGTIAERLGIRGGKGAAYHLVNAELKRRIREDVEDLRAWEDARLNEMLTVYYPKALAGDGWSFDRVLRLMERRAALLGLDMPKASQDGGNGPQTIIQAVPAVWAAAFTAQPAEAQTPVLAPAQEGVAE